MFAPIAAEAVMKPTILVVEDDRDTLQPLSQLLSLKGYLVYTATDSLLGFRMARERRPDLIITDIALPGPSGLHFISQVRSDPGISATPIIVISGCGPMMLVEAELAGANVCIEKPIDIGVFWSAIEQFTRPPADEVQDQPASEIDLLIEHLRHSSSRDERDDYLRRLKEKILKPRARSSGCV